MDEADRADEERESSLQLALSKALRAADKVPRSSGKCLWCEEPVAQGRRWCNSECREDWERSCRRS